MTTITPTDRRINVNISVPLGAPKLQLKRRALMAFVVLRSVVVVVGNPPKAALKKLAEIPLTVLGVASVDFAAFHVGHGWGWLVTGLSLIMLEYMVSDE